MTTTPAVDPHETGKYSLPPFLTLIAAGLASNYFKLSIFLNINFLFGSIFALITAVNASLPGHHGMPRLFPLATM